MSILLIAGVGLGGGVGTYLGLRSRECERLEQAGQPNAKRKHHLRDLAISTAAGVAFGAGAYVAPIVMPPSRGNLTSLPQQAKNLSQMELFERITTPR